jgi:DNA-binding transcriptional LysR family regulator
MNSGGFTMKNRPSLASLDLNLLVVFGAVMEERSVTKAAQRLGLSQPALSHALTRLRHMLKDDLFIPTPAGMMPTPRAQQLSDPLKEALDKVRDAIEPDEFDPTRSHNHFRIAVDSYGSIVFARPITEWVHARAPYVLLDFRLNVVMDAPQVLEADEFDLAIGPFAKQGSRFDRQILAKDDFVIALNQRHQRTDLKPLPLADFASIPHIEITSAPYTTEFVDEALTQNRLKRQVIVRAPTLSTMLLLLEGEYLCIGRRRALEVLVSYGHMAMRSLPIPSPMMETSMVWSRRYDNQPAHAWLRKQLVEVAKRIESGAADFPH